jgi:hypothetical protein
MFLAAKTAERCTVWMLRACRRAVMRFVAWVTDSSQVLPRNQVSGADPLLKTFQLEMPRRCLVAIRLA